MFKILFAFKNSLDDKHWVAELIDRSYLQNIHAFQISYACICIFVKQRIQNGLSLVTILGKVIALFDVVYPFPTCQRRLIICNMAHQIEGVKLLPDLLLQLFQKYALLCKLIHNGLLAACAVPCSEDIVQCCILIAHIAAGVVRQ